MRCNAERRQEESDKLEKSADAIASGHGLVDPVTGVKKKPRRFRTGKRRGVERDGTASALVAYLTLAGSSFTAPMSVSPPAATLTDIPRASP